MRHTIIVGFGPAGRHVADTLSGIGVPVTIVERNAATVRTQRALGRRIIHGDAVDPGVLEAAGIAGASALVLAIPETEAALRACRLARVLAPDLTIIVRAANSAEAMAARALGADSVAVDEIETAAALARAVADRFEFASTRKEGAD